MNKNDKALNELVIKSNRPDAVDHTPEQSEHKSLFDAYLRHGDDEQGLRKIQTKAMSMGSDPDGGYFIPSELDASIQSLVRNLSPLRQLARVVSVQTTDIKFLVSQSDISSGWVHETESRPVTDSGTIAQIQPAFGELYAAPSVTQQLADDSFIDLDAFLANDIASMFAATEGTAFFTGTGVNQPRGFLDYDTASTADASRDFGTIQYIPSGASGAFTTGAGSSDSLVDLVHALKPAHRQNAAFVMNSATLGAVRKIRDAAGDPIFVQTISAGTPSTLLGYPIFETESMPLMKPRLRSLKPI